jgi:hypothetical protein
LYPVVTDAIKQDSSMPSKRVSQDQSTRKFNKVFGIGLSRTGTKSLNAALNRLGIRTRHYPVSKSILRCLENQDYSFELDDRCDGILDITVSPFYRELDEFYPGSKFILTTRDPCEWADSLELHWLSKERKSSQKNLSPTQKSIRSRLRILNYGRTNFERETMLRAFHEHNQRVMEYFKNRHNALLVMNIPSGDGWERLCPFLELPVRQDPFPCLKNRKKPGNWTAPSTH